MPGFDGTGPMGYGPMTGGGRGLCVPGGTAYAPTLGWTPGYGRPTAFGPGFGYARPFGFGRGFGRGRDFVPHIAWSRGFARGRRRRSFYPGWRR